MFKALSRPYFIENDPSFRLKQALLFGLFVFGFLYIFQPFQIVEMKGELWFNSLAFGLVTCFSMLFMNILVPKVYPKFFNDEGWTVGKEIFFSLLNIGFIGLLNYLLFITLSGFTFRPTAILWFQGVTLGIGLFPMTLYVIFKEQRIRKRYAAEAEDLSNLLEHDVQLEEATSSSDLIELPSQNQSESFSVAPDRLLFIKASDNYVEVHYIDQKPKKVLLRNTLKVMEDALVAYSNLLRCHKSYLVNLQHVSHISGNAQGYKLHIEQTDYQVPVSRQNNELIKAKLPQ